MKTKVSQIPISQKITLTIREAAEYSGLDISEIDRMLREPFCPFILYVGSKRLVKREEFEEYIHERALNDYENYGDYKMQRTKKDTKRLFVNLDREIYERLEELCAKSGMSKTAAVEEILSDFFQEY